MLARLFLALFTTCAVGAAAPNILFIFSDDHAYQAISAYGSNRNHTPNIDRLAREGMIFHNALVTNSICAPSRAVILTGKYSHMNSVVNNRDVFDGAQQTFPKLLQKVGYQTAMFGKWHLKSDPTGFDEWEVLPGQGHYYNPDFRIPGGTHQRQGYVTDLIGDMTLDWLSNEWDRDKPFMVMSQQKAPHRNWMPADRHLSLFDGMDLPEPSNLFDNYENRAQVARVQAMEIGRHMAWGHDLKVMPSADDPGFRQYMNSYGRMTPKQKAVWDAVYEPKNDAMKAADLQGRELVRWKYQRYIKDYLRTIAAVDENVGRLLRWLDEEGLADNTIVIYSSDQGFYLGEHGWFDKRWMYEESFRTPLLARWPGMIKPGSENSELVSNLDYAETFLDIAGGGCPQRHAWPQPRPDLQRRDPNRLADELLLPLPTKARRFKWAATRSRGTTAYGRPATSWCATTSTTNGSCSTSRPTPARWRASTGGRSTPKCRPICSASSSACARSTGCPTRTRTSSERSLGLFGSTWRESPGLPSRDSLRDSFAADA